MLIPAIDLQGGAVVQLVQGERLAIKDEDVFGWVKRFERFPKVQVIDLDAAMGVGDNLDLVRQIAGALSCRVGGGVRTSARASEILAAGAQQIIAGSALFKDGRPDVEFAKRLADAVGPERIIAAVDSRGGQVVIHGWKTPLPLTAVEAVQALEPYCGEFLYTHVDTEGLMQRNELRRHSGRSSRHHPAPHGRRRHHDPRRDRRSRRPWRRCGRRDGDLHRKTTTPAPESLSDGIAAPSWTPCSGRIVCDLVNARGAQTARRPTTAEAAECRTHHAETNRC